MLKRFDNFSTERVSESKADGMVTKITPKVRNKANKDLREVLKKTYFSSIPLDEIFDVLNSNGLVALQEDNTEWSGILCGTNSRMDLPLADITTKRQVNDIDTYVPMDNTSLVVTWCLVSKNYEVIAYVG